jgi:PKD repeat protein
MNIKNYTKIIASLFLAVLCSQMLCSQFLFAQNVSTKQEKRAIENMPTPELSYKFIQNQRQWHESVLFKANIPNGNLFMKQTSIIYSFLDPSATSHQHDNIGKNEKDTEVDTTHKKDEKIKGHGVEVEFVGANLQTTISPEGESTENYNYFIGNDQSKWASNLKAYSNLTYQNLYHGVDMRFYTEHHDKNRALKYEFKVAPKTNPNQIQLKYKGATKLDLDADGNLQIGTSVLDFIEQKPYCYQIIEGEKREVKSKFVLKDSTISFELGKYELAYELVIDPEIVFCSYVGSLVTNSGMSATFDNEGNLYSGGIGYSQGMPTTIGAFDVTFNGASDIVISKFNSTGTQLVYFTFIGGSETETPNSLIVNSQGNLVIMSTTQSTDFPTTVNAYDVSHNGGFDFAVVILNNTGSALLASTFVGGSNADGIAKSYFQPFFVDSESNRGEVDLDSNDNIFVASSTKSSNFPVVNGIGNNNINIEDGVVFKLSKDLKSLMWSTYLTGSKADMAYAVNILANQDVIVAGTTESSDFATTPNSFQPSHRGLTDGFIRRYASTGTLLNSSFLGSTSGGEDLLFMMDTDLDNNIYVVGTSRGGNHPISPSTYNVPNGNQFLYKLSPTLDKVIWSTKIGAIGQADNFLAPTGFMVSNCEEIYLAGWASGINTGGMVGNLVGFPTTSDAIRQTTNGNDFYVARYGKNCSSLGYATFFGSSIGNNHSHGGTSRFSKEGTIYHNVCMDNNGMPTTPNAWRPAKVGGGMDNAVIKINGSATTLDFDIIDAATGNIVPNGLFCFPVNIKLKNKSRGANSYLWNLGIFGNSTAFEPTLTINSAGSYQFTLKINSGNCQKELTKTLHTQTFAPLVSPNQAICIGESAQLNAYGGTQYTWSPTTGLNNANIANPIATPTTTTTYRVRINYANRCTKDTTVTITIKPLPSADFNFAVSTTCASDRQSISFTNLSSNGLNYLWDFGNGQTSTLQNPIPVTYLVGNYIVKLTVSSPTTCDKIISKTISVQPFAPRISASSVICRGSGISLIASGGTSYQWIPTTGLNNATIATPFATPSQTTTYTVRITNGTCVKDTSVTITLKSKPPTDFAVTLENTPCYSFPIVRIINNTPNNPQYSYIWSIADIGAITTRDIAPFRFTSAGTKLIWLRVIDNTNNTCDSVLTKQLVIPTATVNSLNPTISATTLICKGTTAFLNATGGTNYAWTPATGLNNPNIANPRATPTETTTYTVRISNAISGCFKDSSVTVNVVNPVVPTFSVAQTVDCEAMPLITLTNNSIHQAGVTYFWSFGDGQTSTLQNPPPFRYAFAGNYSIRLNTNSSTSCGQTVLNRITVLRNLNGIDATVTPNRTICAGTSTLLQATGGISYLWSPSTGLSNATMANPTANPTETTTYTVKIGNATNCFVERKVTIEVLPSTIPDFDLVLPEGCVSAAKITINNKTQHQNGNTYLWSFGNGETSILQNPAPVTYSIAGTYTVRLTTNQGTFCEQTLTKIFRITANGTNFLMTTISVPPIICEDEEIQLLATGGTSYLWTPSTGLSNPTIANPIAKPLQTTTYRVLITNGTCRTTAIANVVVQPKLIIDFDVQLLDICNPLPLVTIRNKSGLPFGTNYLWDFGNGQTSNLQNPTPFRYAAVGTYTISLSVSYGACSNKFTQTVKIEDSKVYNVTISAPQSICEGSTTQLLATGGTKYFWTPATGLNNRNIANPIATPTTTTRYAVRITNEQGCSKDTSVVVTVTSEIKPDFELQVTAECGKNGTVKFINRSTGTGEYKWILGNGEELKGQNPADYGFEKSGEYEIILEVFNGVCRKTKSQKVKVETVKPANVITPNGDGKNDRFVLDMLNEGWKLEIYDRNGALKFQSDNYKNDWGAEAENQLYYYLLTSPNGKTCRGWVMVVGN